jgi:molecular chaperone GrpE
METTINMFNKKIVPLVKKWVIGVFQAVIMTPHPTENPIEFSMADENADLSLAKEDQWKAATLEDFKSWLNEMPRSMDGARLDVTPDTCDLYTLFSEFIALRQEIRMQNREQNRTLKALNSIQSMTDEYQDALHLFQEKSKDLAGLETSIRLTTEKNAAAYFFDVRDTLVRGHRASLEISRQKLFFRPPPKGMEKICQGYEMAIRRFDKALAGLEIYPVETCRTLFNPKTMRAVEIKKEPGTKKGIVIADISGGFIRNNEVLKFARVVVAE